MPIPYLDRVKRYSLELLPAPPKMICASLTGAVPAVGGAAAAPCSVASRSPRCSLASASFAAPNSRILSNGVVCKRPQMLTRLPPAAAAAAVAEAEAEESLGVPVVEDEGKEVGDSSHSSHWFFPQF